MVLPPPLRMATTHNNQKRATSLMVRRLVLDYSKVHNNGRIVAVAALWKALLFLRSFDPFQIKDMTNFKGF